jgi:SAM-dependent methyltransferase
MPVSGRDGMMGKRIGLPGEKPDPLASTEAQRIQERYERRANLGKHTLYNPLNSTVYLGLQERERALIRWVKRAGIAPVEEKKVLEIGCGSGGNLLQLIRLGFRPENIVGNELLPERAETARRLLPCSTQVTEGDASELDYPEHSFDVVLQFTVFSSLLDDAFQLKLASRIWSLVKPDGGVLWYDFTFNNPRNPDVRGVSMARIQQLFPDGDITAWRLTLAPPISRLVTRVHPCLYSLFNFFPFLRTHLLCWIKKTGEGTGRHANA